jgi:hypothetical protein
LPKGVDKFGGAKIHRARTLDEAFSKAERETRLVQDLEAVSDTAIIVQKAFEPDAPVGTVRHYQQTTRTVLMSTTRLDITDAGQVGALETSYTWKVEKRSAEFIVRQASTTSAGADSAKAVAALSQLGADGSRIIQVAGEGPTGRAAIESATRILHAQGQIETLGEIRRVTSGTALLSGADKYLLAAGALGAGWEWSESMQTSDPLLRFMHQAKAVRIAAETVFSLNPTGAVLVAATNLGEYALQQLIPPAAWEVLHDGLNIVFFGRASTKDGKAAFNQMWPEIQTFATEADAGLLPYEMHKGNDVPAHPWPFGVIVLAVVAISQRKRRDC